MKVVEPSHKEIMKHLDCCHYSKWHEGQCTCFCAKDNFQTCYEEAKKHLTKTVYEADEIEHGQARNKQSMDMINKAIAEAFGDWDEIQSS